jgi:2-polyprenyl-3-methyl-5-hydroxy-6-metoxy-1,4-benzoquinol methylase
MPIEEDIGKAYRTYFTHQDNDLPNTLLRRAYQRVKDGYTETQYGYQVNGVSTFDRLLGRLIYLHPGRRADLDSSVFYLSAQLGGQLLEVGCGSGTRLKRMADLGWRVEGVDFDPIGVRNAQAKGLKVHLGKLAEQRYAADTFDAVVMNHVIEHVPDPRELLIECHRILKPGGRLVVITPNEGSWGHRLYRTDWRGLEPPRHLHLFNSASLTTLIAPIHFKNIKSHSSGRARFIFCESQSLRRADDIESTGRYPILLRMWAEMMELVECSSLTVMPGAGEEIVMLCKK